MARLSAGGLVAIPTETVYGLGADADDGAAVARIFAAKGRPADHPLIVHLAGPEWLPDWAASVPPAAAVLAEACWPGPLTLLLPRAARVLDAVTGGRDTVGLRVPAHPLTEALLRRSGRRRGGAVGQPLRTRSARRRRPTCVADLGPYLEPGRDVVLDGGPCTGRRGEHDRRLHDRSAPAAAPGRHPDRGRRAPARRGGGRTPRARAGPRACSTSHYAPTAPVVLAADRGAADAAAAAAERRGERVALVDLGDDLVAYARELYARLRAADEDGATLIVAVLPPARRPRPRRSRPPARKAAAAR